MNNSNNSSTNSGANRPLRFENLFPGSLFTIVAERSRKIYKSRDKRVYRKAYDGFYSTNVETGEGCVLMPEDIVQRVPNNKRGNK